jgi:hypothetical protein
VTASAPLSAPHSRDGVATSSSPVSSAGGATDDRPGRKPGFTDPPAARAPAGRQNPAAPAALPARILRRRGEETGSCRLPLLVFLSSLRRTSSGFWGAYGLTRSREESGSQVCPVSTSVLSAARRGKTPVPFAPRRGINRNAGWGRGTGTRRDTELAEWEGNRWLVPCSFAALLLLSVQERNGGEKPRSREAAKGTGVKSVCRPVWCWIWRGREHADVAPATWNGSCRAGWREVVPPDSGR